jgi:Flp pilus assembly protein TadD
MRIVKAFLAVSSLLLLLLLSVDSTQAVAAGRSFTGKLIFETPGLSCTPCQVTLLSSGGQPIGMTIADSAGNFTFENVEGGIYTIQIEMEGFEQIEQQVNVMDGFSSGTTTVLIAPKPIAPADKSNSATVDASDFLSGYPKKAVELYKKGMDNKKKGKNDQAVKYFEQAIDIAPNFYAAHNQLGVAYKEAGRKDDAEREFLRAHELNRADADPLINLTSLYIDQDQPGRAVETGEQAVKANSRSASAFFSLGMALYKFAMLDRAETALKKALELAPKMFQVRLVLANVYMKQHRYDNLMEQLDRYLAENPNGEQRPAVEDMRRTLIQARQQGNNRAQ